MGHVFRRTMIGIATVAWLIVAAGAQAADPPATKYSIEGMDDYMPKLSKFLELIAKGEIDKGFELLGKPKEAALDPEFAKEYEEVKKRLMVFKELGGYRECEATAVKNVTTRLHKVYVVATFEAKPVLFTFVMYKPGTDWQCRDVDFGTKIDDFIETYPMVTDLKKR